MTTPYIAVLVAVSSTKSAKPNVIFALAYVIFVWIYAVVRTTHRGKFGL
jgi:hypothetical protein